MFLKSAMWNALLAVVPMIALSVQAHKSWMPGMIKFEPNGDYTCTNQDEHCIFVNGNRYGYSFEFTNGLNPADLTCAKRIEGRPGQVAYYTGPCKTTTARGPISIRVRCRDPDNVENVSQDYADVTFLNDNTGITQTNGDQVWADLQASSNNQLVQGRSEQQYPHVGGVVNCYSDNRNN